MVSSKQAPTGELWIQVNQVRILEGQSLADAELQPAVRDVRTRIVRRARER